MTVRCVNTTPVPVPYGATVLKNPYQLVFYTNPGAPNIGCDERMYSLTARRSAGELLTSYRTLLCKASNSLKKTREEACAANSNSDEF
jgi:hypothetical protein